MFLAGDDVSWTAGWAEGAVQTALNAVWGVMHHFGGATHPDNPGPGDGSTTSPRSSCPRRRHRVAAAEAAPVPQPTGARAVPRSARAPASATRAMCRAAIVDG